MPNFDLVLPKCEDSEKSLCVVAQLTLNYSSETPILFDAVFANKS